MAEFYSKHALKLDAEYDGGASDHQSDNDSDELECFAPVGKLSRKASSMFSSSKRGDKKRQKTQEKEQPKQAAVDKADLMVDNSDISDSDQEPVSRPSASSNSPSQRKISALQRQMKQVVEGYNSTAAAFADVSATEETEEAGAYVGCGGIDEELAKSITIAEPVAASTSKCVIEVKSSDNEQGKKFRIFMTDPMSKIFSAYCTKAKLGRDGVKFVFDGLAIDDNATPQDLGMEEEDENMIELQVKRR